MAIAIYAVIKVILNFNDVGLPGILDKNFYDGY